MEYEGGRMIEETVVTGGEYCYGDGKAMYDSKGRKIKESSHHKSGCKSHH